MRGLKTQEGKKFERFFALVQQAAAKEDAVFFLECGEGNDFSTDQMEGEILRGWLIPNKQADKFEKVWLKGSPGDEWADHIAWATWSGSKAAPVIAIESF